MCAAVYFLCSTLACVLLCVVFGNFSVHGYLLCTRVCCMYVLCSTVRVHFFFICALFFCIGFGKFYFTWYILFVLVVSLNLAFGLGLNNGCGVFIHFEHVNYTCAAGI